MQPVFLEFRYFSEILYFILKAERTWKNLLQLWAEEIACKAVAACIGLCWIVDAHIILYVLFLHL